MKKVKFVYDEPMIGFVEIESPDIDDQMDEQTIMNYILDAYPEATNVEILEVEEIN